jgi:hypothetical protein
LATKWHTREYIRQVERTTEAKLDALCDRIVNDIRRDMKGPKTGKPGKQTTASAPGESPAAQTGHLRRNISHHKSGRLRQKLGTNIRYGLDLELGTKPHTITAKGKALAWKGADGEAVFAKSVQHPGVKPRPWLRPALGRARVNFRQLWKDK